MKCSGVLMKTLNFKSSVAMSDKKTKKHDFPTKKEFNELKKLVNTHHDYLNNIFTLYELEPARYMELMRSISFELFKFF